MTVGFFIEVDDIEFTMLIDPLRFIGDLPCLISDHSHFIQSFDYIKNVQMLARLLYASLVEPYHLLVFVPAADSVQARDVYMQEQHKLLPITKSY